MVSPRLSEGAEIGLTNGEWMAPIAIEDGYWEIKYLQLPFSIQPNTDCQLNLVWFYAGNLK